jgi:hypothetical protein
MSYDSFDFSIPKVFNRNIGRKFCTKEPCYRIRVRLSAILVGLQRIAGLHDMRGLLFWLQHCALPVKAIKNGDEGAGGIVGYHNFLDFVIGHGKSFAPIRRFERTLLFKTDAPLAIPCDNLNPVDCVAGPLQIVASGGNVSLGDEWL